MAHRLALAVGVWDVQGMLERMSATQWGNWLLYFEHEPYGGRTEDVRVARLMALLANINRDPKKRSKPFEPREFVPFEVATPPKPPKLIRSEMLFWASKHNASLKNKAEQ